MTKPNGKIKPIDLSGRKESTQLILIGLVLTIITAISGWYFLPKIIKEGRVVNFKGAYVPEYCETGMFILTGITVGLILMARGILGYRKYKKESNQSLELTR